MKPPIEYRPKPKRETPKQWQSRVVALIPKDADLDLKAQAIDLIALIARNRALNAARQKRYRERKKAKK